MRSLLTFAVASLAMWSFLLVVAPKSARAAEDHSADEAAVKKCVDDFTAAWNRHDPAATAAVFTEEGTLINPFGATARSRAEIQKIFEPDQAGPLKQSSHEAPNTKMQWPKMDVDMQD